MKVLIVGGGSIGERHLRCFQQTPPCQVALCENNDERRAHVGASYGLEQTFATLSAAAQQQWDAAVICTPAQLHVEHTLELAPVTGAILIEKPLATRLDDAQRLLPLAGEKPLAVAYVLRGHPAVQEVRALLQAGKLGQLLQVTVHSGQHFPTFRPAYREIYYRDRATGGGAVQDAATHSFNLVQYFAGHYDWVFCDHSHQALEDVEVEDTVHFLGRAGGGKIMVSISLNQFMAPNETVLQLNGNRGSVQLRLHEQRYGVMLHGDDGWQWSEPLVQERDDLFRRQASQFLDVASGKSEPLCSLQEALHTLQVNLAALDAGGVRQIGRVS